MRIQRWATRSQELKFLNQLPALSRCDTKTTGRNFDRMDIEGKAQLGLGIRDTPHVLPGEPGDLSDGHGLDVGVVVGGANHLEQRLLALLGNAFGAPVRLGRLLEVFLRHDTSMPQHHVATQSGTLTASSRRHIMCHDSGTSCASLKFETTGGA